MDRNLSLQVFRNYSAEVSSWPKTREMMISLAKWAKHELALEHE